MSEYSRPTVRSNTSTYTNVSKTYLNSDGSRDVPQIPKYCPHVLHSDYPPRYDSLQHGPSSIFSGTGYFQFGSAYHNQDPQRVARPCGSHVSCSKK